jgi:RNA methyltransferase, TrmH family
MTKNEIKYYSKLLQKKHRQNENKFLVEGSKLIIEGINADFICEIIFVTKSFYENNLDFLDAIVIKQIRTEQLKPIDFDKLSDTKTSQGIIAVFKMPTGNGSLQLSENVVIGLENVSDPGNLGTVLRNCDWFGINQIILSDSCAEVYSPKVIRASAGSVFHLKINELSDFYDFLQSQKHFGYKILCADLDGENIFSFSKREKSILILANEANGPTQKLLGICDSTITIPRTGKAESLNVASASAILISEFTRKH